MTRMEYEGNECVSHQCVWHAVLALKFIPGGTKECSPTEHFQWK